MTFALEDVFGVPLEARLVAELRRRGGSIESSRSGDKEAFGLPRPKIPPARSPRAWLGAGVAPGRYRVELEDVSGAKWTHPVAVAGGDAQGG